MKVNPDKLKDLELEYRRLSMREGHSMTSMCYAVLARFASDLRTKCLGDE